MKKAQLHYLRYIAISAGLLLLASLLTHLNFFFPLVGVPEEKISKATIITSAIFFTLLIAIWFVRVLRRVISRRVKIYFCFCDFIMIAWFIIRSIKFTTPNETLSRYLWYFYYFPMILIPLMGVHIAITLRTGKSRYEMRVAHLWDFVSLFMFGLVVTNDYHGFVFELIDGSRAYIHRWGYYLVALWMITMAACALIIVIRQSRISLSGFYYLYPTALVGTAIIYTFIYVYKESTFQNGTYIELTAAFCWFFTAVWEYLITAGLVPTNRGYIHFFNDSTITAYITDDDGKVVYESKNAKPLTEEEFRVLLSEGSLMTDNAEEFQAYKLSSGYIVYENDMSVIMDLIEELEDAREGLKGETIIRQKANEAEAAQIRIEEKQYLFEKMTGATMSQMRRIRENLKRVEELEDADTDKLWEEILILGTYVKRYSNLLLIKEEGSKTSAIELKLCLMQSMENLKLRGINTGLMIKDEGLIDIENILQCYELFEQLAEWNLDGLKSIHVVYSPRADEGVFLIEAECERGFEEFEFYEYDGSFSAETEGKTISAVLTWKMA